MVANWVPQVLGFLSSGASSGWWGLWCPAHCSGSLVVLAAVFLSGVGFGALGVPFLFKEALFLRPPVFHSGPQTPSPALRRRARLQDRSQPSDLDLESLAEAFAQLQVAAGALTRALQPEHSRQDARRPLLPGLALHLPPPRPRLVVRIGARELFGLGPPLGLCLTLCPRTFCLWCPPCGRQEPRSESLVCWLGGGGPPPPLQQQLRRPVPAHRQPVVLPTANAKGPGLPSPQSVAKLLGPPPRTRAATAQSVGCGRCRNAAGAFGTVLARQGSALTLLVNHLISQASENA